MSQSPLVSVCVPTYNYARFLPNCIESVLQQTLSDWELVITDDASSDETGEIAGRYAAADPRIRYIRNPVRLGMNGNLKRAAESGRGRYLKILCADDWLAPRCLQVLCGLMESHPNAALATSAEIHSDAAGLPLFVQFLFGAPLTVASGEKMLDRMAKGHGFGGNSSFMVRASAYAQSGGFDPDLLYAADYDLAARLCRLGDYLHTDEPLFYGRSHPASSSSVNPAKLWDAKDSFTIPEKVFRPRRFPNCEWRRYHRLTALLTARYLLTASLEFLRGHRSYARGLADVVRRQGNIGFGILYLPGHAIARLYRRTTGSNVPNRSRPEPWMGLPTQRIKGGRRQGIF
jgi:glycosyltransferase involved in cell wall biosynthesis